MWYLIQYRNDRELGVIEAFDFSEVSTRLCVTNCSSFSVASLSELVKITPDESGNWTFEKWLIKANVAILASFESDDPIRDLPILFPEYFI